MAFYGTEVAYATDRKSNSTRWTNIRVYRTDKGGYVVGIAKLTCWDGERDSLDAPKAKNRKEVLQIVRQHAPDLAEIVEIELNSPRPMVKETAKAI